MQVCRALDYTCECSLLLPFALQRMSLKHASQNAAATTAATPHAANPAYKIHQIG